MDKLAELVVMHGYWNTDECVLALLNFESYMEHHSHHPPS